ncbi:MAG: DUF4368 domain-containing protein [Oscillospiraceae bacterium]|nr:DUF4368 domain-containing protein [Oscillospiraceae bacterium]
MNTPVERYIDHINEKILPHIDYEKLQASYGNKIVVHHRQRIDGVDEQTVEIFYNCVGPVTVPDMKKIPQTEVCIPTRKGVAVSYASA